MKILSVKLTNFGSYPELQFSFDNLGLALISGATGAGKSTIMDAVPWILFGCTAKAGGVEDVRSWKVQNGKTIGVCTLDVRGTRLVVERIRGNATSNDLFWYAEGDEPTRGKDLHDTQRLLEARLGVTADQFLASSYLHEFSTVGTFFTSSAKSRRSTLEGLTDLTLPNRIAERASESRRVSKGILQDIRQTRDRTSGKLDQLQESQSATKESAENWRKDQKAKIEDLKAKAETYEADKARQIELERSKYEAWRLARLESLSLLEGTAARLRGIVKDSKQFDIEESEIRNSLRCGKCGSLPDNVNEALIDCRERRVKNNNHNKELQTTLKEIKSVRAQTNPYSLDKNTEFVNNFKDLLDTALKESSPFEAQYHRLRTMICDTEAELIKLQAEIGTLERRIAALSHLYDLAGVLRGELLRKAVTELQDLTNAYLEKYFDAEIRVLFSAGDADNIEVEIFKSGYSCNYKQLSRGQRALLKICFGVGVMKMSANQIGYHPNVIMFDETLDALDEDKKVKAFCLFEQLSLEHSTVLVIDHCEALKVMFNKRYNVSLIEDQSVIEEV